MQVLVERAYVRREGAEVEVLRMPPGTPFCSSRMVVPPNACTHLDQHEDEEIWFLVHGEGVLSLDGVETHVAAPDALHFRPNQTHQLRNTGSESILVCSVWWGG